MNINKVFNLAEYFQVVDEIVNGFFDAETGEYQPHCGRVVGLTVFYNHCVVPKNNPLFNAEGLYALPAGTKMMTKTPYMEYTVGIENIFKFLRIDYIRRISYTEGLSESEKHGFKISLRFTI